uniref:PLD phosphodiesterase domain-containing protein n=1 Tax=Clastoptera arizonana TaxID=38151 RepID=A0A1B6C9A8_9HEMI
MTVYTVKIKSPESNERLFEQRQNWSSDFDDWDSRYMLRTDQDDFGDKHDIWGQKGWFKPSCIPISILLVLIMLVVILPLLDGADKQAMQKLYENTQQLQKCHESCRFSLVESIPEGMSYRNGTTPFPSTYQVWTDMINNAQNKIEIASYYWTLRYTPEGLDSYPGMDQGKKVFEALLNAGTTRGLTLKIAQNKPSRSQPNLDTEALVRAQAAEVRNLDFPKLIGSGILHTKLWIVDRTHVYVGSANSDWRSLTQVKELGIYIQDCKCLAEDISKIFDVYWMMGENDAKVPAKWPDYLATLYNNVTPMNLSQLGKIYLSSSPPQFCPTGRTDDGSSIKDVIGKANRFVNIAVMDYFPTTLYTPKPIYWGDIDDALKTAAIDKHVEVRLLISWWNHSHTNQKLFLKSLADISGTFPNVNITVKLFVVPSTSEQSKIPFARVNHNKYMVTDNTAYIGTSNWSGDYFISTGGVGVIIEGLSEIREQLESVFMRDWNSEFAYALPR